MIVATQSNSTTKSIVKKEMACADMTIDDIHKPHVHKITSYNTVRMGEHPASSHHAKVCLRELTSLRQYRWVQYKETMIKLEVKCE